MNQELIIIADPHLGSQPEDIPNFIDFLKSLNPAEQHLILLGDLFQAWTAYSKHWDDDIKKVILEFQLFQQQGGQIDFVVGNRDIAFQDQDYFCSNGLPFHVITNQFYCLTFSNGKIIMNHGDLVNKHDQQYLKWRKIIKSKFLKALIYSLPVKIALYFLHKMEYKLRATNQKFKKKFPAIEWKNFLAEIYQQYQPQLCIIGHFHPDDLIKTQYKTMLGIVVPAWFKKYEYLIVTQDFQTTLVKSNFP